MTGTVDSGASIHVVEFVVRQILSDVANDPDNALSELTIGKRYRKKALRVDVNAEDTFFRTLRTYRDNYFADVVFYGEERLRDPTLDLRRKDGVFALVDAVDGTDLVERGFGNWCTAAVFFAPRNPPASRILASCVGLPDGSIYSARSDDEHAWVVRGGSNPAMMVRGPSGAMSLAKASLCFYGQKPDHFLSVERLLRGVQSRAKSFRIYNLAGIPMMMTLLDHGNQRESCGVDAVIELLGQKPHDFVPGIFIAMKARATVLRPNGTPFTPIDLEEMLFRPAATRSEQRYVLAASRRLAGDIVQSLRGAHKSTVGRARRTRNRRRDNQ